jgi:hypothetical protein
VNDANTYNISYDDGDYEQDVQARLIRHPLYKVNDKVEARFLGGRKWYPGAIVKVLKPDGVVDGGGSGARYNILYDDGDEEEGVSPLFIQHATK